jgi:cytochrome c oxidase subunit 1
MSAMGFAVVNLALGGALSFVLIQEKLAPLLSDTFFVPGYFHFLTVGTVTLTFLAAFAYVLPALTGRPLWRPQVLRWMPHLASAGLLLFGGAGVAAGYLGVPRRVLEISYDGAAPAAWTTLMSIVGVGGALMSAALVVYVYAFVRTIMPARRAMVGRPLTEVRWGGVAIDGGRAWTGPLAVVVLLGLTVVFTGLAFEVMRALPLAATGGGAH